MTTATSPTITTTDIETMCSRSRRSPPLRIGSRFRGRGYSRRASARQIRRALSSTTGPSTASSPMASRRTRRSITGTCRQDRGGWERRDTAEAFADYAGYVAEKLSDRARHFFTLNECATFVELGHGTGVFAPGLKLQPGRLNQVRHHALLAHGLAVQAIRARSRAGTQAGPAENVSVCVPVIETPEHIAAAELTTRELNAFLPNRDHGRPLPRSPSWRLPVRTPRKLPPRI